MAAALVQVRKISGAQTAHWSASDSEAGAYNVFSATLCGRPMVLGEWSELDPLAQRHLVGHGPSYLFQPCMRCDAKLAKIREAAHVEAIAEDIRRFPGWTDADERIESAREEEHSNCPGCAECAPDAPLCSRCGGTRVGGQGAACPWCGAPEEEHSAPTFAPDAYVIANYEDGELGTRHVVARIYGSDSGDSYRPTDGARWSDDPYGDPAQYGGTQGSADTLCGTIAYGIVYAADQGPAVTCQDCKRARGLLWPSEETSAPQADIVPTHEYRPDAYGYCAECGRTWTADVHSNPPQIYSGPVNVAVRATAVLLGSSEEEARAHLNTLHRSTVVDSSAQDVIGAAYDALPLVDTSDAGSLVSGHAWEAMAHEVLSQADVLRALGITWTVVDTDPYANAGELFAELRSTGGIRVLSSAVTGGHPLWSDTVNETFRAVHDILGHAATGRGFDRHGEEAAYQAHAALFSPLARQALATETRGQNSSMLRAGGVFPSQKIAVLPEWARDVDALKPRRSRYSDEERADMRADAARDHAAQGLGEWAGR